MEISIVLPAFKEEENLKILLPKINNTLNEMNILYEVLVVDAMSPQDGTYDICKENKVKYTNRKHGNLYGDAIRTGIDIATGKWIIILDADGSHNPKDFKNLYNKVIEGYDIVVGSRYANGGNSHNGAILKLMSFIVNSVYRVAFQFKLKDISNSFRIYNANQLKQLQLTSNNFDIVEEILILYSIEFPDYKFCEIPIYFDKRLFGDSKRDLLKFSLSYLKSIIHLLSVKRNAKNSKMESNYKKEKREYSNHMGD